MNPPSAKKIGLPEAAQETGLSSEAIIHFIQLEWIVPAEAESPLLDEEDLARMRLIAELQNEFGVNDEAVPIILHLIDQLHWHFKRGR